MPAAIENCCGQQKRSAFQGAAESDLDGDRIMTGTVNLREVILGILMEVTEGEAYSHIALRDTLEKYQYLPKRDRAFVSRVTEGTLENLIQIDYVIECFSKVPIHNMKPLIRNLLRMSIYQLKYMDSIPDSAVVNEAVRLAQKRGFYNLKGFVNGVLRAAAREPPDQFPAVGCPGEHTELTHICIPSA